MLSLRSLRVQLILLWLLMLVICVAIAVVMLGVYRQGADAQIDRARGLTERSCQAMQVGYDSSRQDQRAIQPPDIGLLNALLELSMRDSPGVEGGVWSATEGFLAYAFPTYEGTGVKRDVPEAERARIAAVAARAAEQRGLLTDVKRGTREALVLTACALDATLTAWTLARVSAGNAQAYSRLNFGLGLLLLFVLASGVWIGTLLHRWSQRLGSIERALAMHTVDELPTLAMSGERDLDRIVVALNQLGTRLRTAHEQSRTLERSLAHAERLAALGRLAAGLAHEIRNPLGAIRLRAENALSAADERKQRALAHILEQVARLDRLLASLLALTQPFQLQRQLVRLDTWLQRCAADISERAHAAGVTMRATSNVEQASFDPDQLARAVENLLLNAIQHTPAGGEVSLHAERRGEHFAIQVQDTGSGVPAEVKPHLFEPFVTGRNDGTGLGLSLVREIVVAHGGTVRHMDVERGTLFEIEIPWRAS